MQQRSIHFDADTFLSAVLRRNYSKEACVILDLATIADAERIISFTKSSSRIGRLPIVAIGTEDQHDGLYPEVRLSLNGVVIAPYTAGELGAVITSVCEHPLPKIQPEPPP